MNATKKKLVEMLTENTGRHLLDSGGAYGRNWEMNQSVDFEKSPQVSVHFYEPREEGEIGFEISASISTYHFLKEFLRFHEEEEEKFVEFIEKYPNSASWLQIMEDYADTMPDRYVVCNTYNEQDHWDLSQVLQFTDIGDGHLILLQIHGGCDVRGGYTAPVCFTTTDDSWAYNAHIDTIAAGDSYWTYSPYLSSTHAQDDYRDDAIPNILQLPVYSKRNARRKKPYIWVEDKNKVWLIHGDRKDEICVGNAYFMS